MNHSSPILILGGGFAGLAAAVDLAAAGKRVLVLERRNFLGGRAYSFTDSVTGDVVDNGQHLMMGCYHHTLDFIRKIGATDKLKFQETPRVDFLHDTEGHASFKCPPVPAPWHLLAGLSKLQTIGWKDRLRALRVGLEMRSLNGTRSRLADITVREWLNEMGQTERMQQRFWDLMALATLNETPERASADMFAEVIERAFMRTKRDSQMVISRTGLSDLYTTDAQKFIEARGGEVRLNASVERIDFENGRAVGVTLRDGERITASQIISAVPYFMLRNMLAPEILAHDAFRAMTQFTSAPIVSINLWYATPVTDLEFVGLLDSRIEWVFNKNAIAGAQHSKLANESRITYPVATAPGTVPAGFSRDAATRQHLALVISGAHEAAKLPKEKLVELAVTEMNRFFPQARQQQPVHSFVVRERDATISHTPGTARLRPTQRTPFHNFFLAGDWTATGLPATIESAVWSGQECARIILRK
jgi:squalene-associated FAD-dependent desaturase